VWRIEYVAAALTEPKSVDGAILSYLSIPMGLRTLDAEQKRQVWRALEAEAVERLVNEAYLR